MLSNSSFSKVVPSNSCHYATNVITPRLTLSGIAREIRIEQTCINRADVRKVGILFRTAISSQSVVLWRAFD